MSIIKSDALASTHGPRAGYTLHEDRPNLFLAGEITQEYLPKVRIVTLPLMMASVDDTARTADPACSTQNCPDSNTLIGCGQRSDEGTGTDTTADNDSDTTDATTGGTSPGGQ